MKVERLGTICTALSLSGMAGDQWTANQRSDGVTHTGEWSDLNHFKEAIRLAIQSSRLDSTSRYGPDNLYFKLHDPLFKSAYLVVTTTMQKGANQYLRELGFDESPTYVNVKYQEGLIFWTIGTFDLAQKVGLQPQPGEKWTVGGDPYEEDRAKVKKRFNDQGIEVKNVGV